MRSDSWIVALMMGFFGLFALAALAYLIAIIWAIVKITLHFT